MKRGWLSRRLDRKGAALPTTSNPLAAPTILVSAPLFELSADLIHALRQHRIELPDAITERYDAFLVNPGLGPATYLSSDGRIIWADDGWRVDATRAMAFAVIRVAASKTGIAALNSLLPRRPVDAWDCPECSATGWFRAHLPLTDIAGKPVSVVCVPCGGLGWTSPSMNLDESVLETPSA